MSFIDWSDPEEMFSLLLEYMEDESNDNDTHADPKRRRFLSRLIRAVSELEERFSALPDTARIESLRNIISTIAGEFESDPVVEHLEACVAELERISSRHDA